MAFTLLGDNKNKTYLDPQTGMPTSRPIQFGFTQPTTNPLLGATTTGTATSATNGNPDAPKLDLLKVIKNPALDTARENWLGDINSQRTQQSEFLKRLNGDVARLNTTALLDKEKGYLDLNPITNQVRRRENEFANGIDSMFRLAQDRATAGTNAALLGQANSSWAQMARGNAQRDAAVPYLTQKTLFGTEQDKYLQGLKLSMPGRETALNQQYLTNMGLPMEMLNRGNAQYGQLLGQNIGMLPGTQFLSVGGGVDTTNNFTGAQPFAPYYGPGNAAVRNPVTGLPNTRTGTAGLLGAPQGVQGGGLLGAPTVNPMGLTQASFSTAPGESRAYAAMFGVYPWQDPMYNAERFQMAAATYGGGAAGPQYIPPGYSPNEYQMYQDAGAWEP